MVCRGAVSLSQEHMPLLGYLSARAPLFTTSLPGSEPFFPLSKQMTHCSDASTVMFLWALCGVPFGVYTVVQNFNIPIQVQPQVFMVLCLVSWAQTLIYQNKWRVWTTTLLAVSIGAVFGGVEAALILTIQVSHSERIV